MHPTHCKTLASQARYRGFESHHPLCLFGCKGTEVKGLTFVTGWPSPANR
jgi:hypothetical protein